MKLSIIDISGGAGEGGGFQRNIKGLVHPKMKIKSLITHPHAVPTP